MNFKKERINDKILLGRGAFGEVRPYQKNEEDQKWAVKIIKVLSFEGLLECFKEIILGFTCDNPYVLPVRGYLVEKEKDAEEWTVYIKLPRMPKGSLRDILNDSKKAKNLIPEDKIAQYFYEMVCGLQYLHAKNIAHRDIKPENILFDENNSIKIADLGIGDLNEGSMLQTQAIKVGDLKYAAPENYNMHANLRKEDLCGTDLWSLGMVMFELCTQIELQKLDNKYHEVELEKTLTEILQKLEKEGKYSKTMIDLILSLLKWKPLERRCLEEVHEQLLNAYGRQRQIDNGNKGVQTEPDDLNYGLRARLQEMEKKLEERNASIEDLQSQKQEWQTKQAVLEEKLRERNASIEDSKKTIDDLQSQKQEWQIKQAVLEEKLRERNASIEDNKKTIDNLQSQKQEWKTKQAVLEEKLRERNASIEDNKKTIDDLQNQKQEWKTKQAVLEENLRERNASIEDLQSQIQGWKTKQAVLEEKLTERNASIEDLQSQIQEWKTKQAVLEEKLGERNASIEEIEKRNKDMTADLERKTKRLGVLEKELQKRKASIKVNTIPILDSPTQTLETNESELSNEESPNKDHQGFKTASQDIFKITTKGENQISVSGLKYKKIHDQSVKELVIKIGTNYRNTLQHLKLNLGFWIKITDQSVNELAMQIGTNLKPLQQLNLNFEDCKQITDQSVKELAIQISNLNTLQHLKLNFVNCYKITDESAEELAKQIRANLSTLQYLNLNFYHSSVSLEMKKGMRSQLKNIKQVFIQ